MKDKLKLYGFNNLTKTVSFNLYDISYATDNQAQQTYSNHINNQYNAKNLTKILCQITEIIGANILNISQQDYDPLGASVTLLISEDIPKKESVVGHLDKSHVTVHTYPEYHPNKSISTFRLDIDVSTCGKISPLNTLNFLIESFQPDIITIDYRVRGFTRGINGQKYFIDHDIQSIQDYIQKSTLQKYETTDVNVNQSNIFHTRMRIKQPKLQKYLFNTTLSDLTTAQKNAITEDIQKEMAEIYSGMNIY